MWSWNKWIWTRSLYFPCVFFIILKSWFSTKSTVCGLRQIHLKLFFLKYKKTTIKQSEKHKSDPPLELPQTQNRWNFIRPEQKNNIQNFDQITSQAGRQPAQFAQLAPERVGLQGEHYFHEFDACFRTPQQRHSFVQNRGTFCYKSNAFSTILLSPRYALRVFLSSQSAQTARDIGGAFFRLV